MTWSQPKNQTPLGCLRLPHFSLVVLIGPAGSGKSTFAQKNFSQTEIISSDVCRAMLTDSPEHQSVSTDAFELAYQWLAKRLRYGRLSVLDATNTTAAARAPLLNLAQKSGATPIALVFDFDVNVAKSRNRQRKRRVPEEILEQQHRELRHDFKSLWHEGFAQIHRFTDPDKLDETVITRLKAHPDKRQITGPFDMIGDVHGCFDELVMLLEKLGYHLDFIGPSIEKALSFQINHPGGRTPIFLGDLCDRGPKSHLVLRLVMDSVDRGRAICLLGNHEVKLRRYLQGLPLQPTHGLQQTIDNLAEELPTFRQRILRFLDRCSPHLVLDHGRLVVAHAGLAEVFHGFDSNKARNFALYGEVRKGTDEYGLPLRGDWAAKYTGSAKVVYGHTPFAEAIWRFGTICIDTGCVFGGKLSALTYPEDELISVPAKRVYFEPIKPLSTFSVTLNPQQSKICKVPSS